MRLVRVDHLDAVGEAVGAVTLAKLDVITSYSIHYTKLYEFAKFAPIKPAPPVINTRSELIKFS